MGCTQLLLSVLHYYNQFVSHPSCGYLSMWNIGALSITTQPLSNAPGILSRWKSVSPCKTLGFHQICVKFVEFSSAITQHFGGCRVVKLEKGGTCHPVYLIVIVQYYYENPEYQSLLSLQVTDNILDLVIRNKKMKTLAWQASISTPKFAPQIAVSAEKVTGPNICSTCCNLQPTDLWGHFLASSICFSKLMEVS
jgi:hypothetical protein